MTSEAERAAAFTSLCAAHGIDLDLEDDADAAAHEVTQAIAQAFAVPAEVCMSGPSGEEPAFASPPSRRFKLKVIHDGEMHDLEIDFSRNAMVRGAVFKPGVSSIPVYADIYLGTVQSMEHVPH